jgi:hypothetical protein
MFIMALTHIWQSYKTEGFEAVKTSQGSTAIESFYLSLLAFGEHKLERATEYIKRAGEQDPENLIFKEALTFLQQVVASGKQSVYATGNGFLTFIRGGGNVSLYEKTSAALQTIYQQYETLSVLDIGVGDGMALLPALTRNIRQLDLLEPSAAMLDKLKNILTQRGIQHQAVCGTVQEFISTYTDSWDVIEATFSLQSIPPEERSEVFAWVRRCGKHFLLAEFDVPEFDSMYAPNRVEYILERYQDGLAEYKEERSLVAQEFLMPVMFGYFDKSACRTNYEQTIQSWERELQQAGFRQIQSQKLSPYWWAPAYLIDAQ